MGLDKKDKQILGQLRLNSRKSFVQIGKAVGLGGLAVQRRVERLKADGIILRLYADVNMAKLGFSSYRIYFKLDAMDKKTEEAIISLFNSYPGTDWGVICEGEYDALWRIFARDELDVGNAIFFAMEKLGEKIIEKNIVTTIYEEYLSWNMVFGAERKFQPPLTTVKGSGCGRHPLDKENMAILAMLSQDSRAKTMDISKKTGLAPDAVNYRIKSLVKEGYIHKYISWLDARKMGFNYYKIFIWFKNSSRKEEERFFKYCMQKDEVMYVNKVLGSWDMEVNILVNNNEELHSLVRELKTKFGGIIGRHAFITIIMEMTPNPLREYL